MIPRKGLGYLSLLLFLVNQLSIFLLFIALFEAPFLLSLLLSPILALFYFQGFCLFHEAGHNLISKRHWLNSFIGFLLSPFSLIPFKSWQDIHNKHHRFTGNIDKDPTMRLIKEYHTGKITFTESSLVSRLWQWWIPVLAFMQIKVLWSYAISNSSSNKEKSLLFAQFMYILALYSGIITLGVPWFSLFLAIFLYLMLIEAINFPHHLETPCFKSSEETPDQLPYPKHYLVTRSCSYPTFFERFFLLNFNYHVEHHMFPFSPWHQLPVLSEHIREEIGSKYIEDKGWSWIKNARKVPIKRILDNTVKELESP
jgi:fatty acid desaturase